MKVVFHRWQICLLMLFIVSLPVQANASSVCRFHESEIAGDFLVVSDFDFGDPGRVLKSVAKRTEGEFSFSPARSADIASSEKRANSGKSASSILRRVDSEHPSATVPSAAKPKELARTAKRVPVKPASHKKASPVLVAKLVEFNRFSIEEFAESGFAPNCMFVDQSTSGSFLENRISGTLNANKATIYSTESVVWGVEPKESDAYWQYFSDCDNWNVVFAKPDLAKVEATPNSLQSPLGLVGGITSRISQMVSQNADKVYQLARKIEFFIVEVPPQRSSPVKQVIKGLKSVRPLVFGLIDHELVRNALTCNKLRQFSFQMHTSGAKLVSICRELLGLPLLGRPFENNASAQNRKINTNSRR